MRWNDDEVPDERERHVKRFAWFPTEVSSVTVWLEHYIERQIYLVDGKHPEWGEGVARIGGPTGWARAEFLLPEEVSS